jgi:hypothetical protein
LGSSFSPGAELDQALNDGMAYGEVILLDCRVIEVRCLSIAYVLLVGDQRL